VGAQDVKHGDDATMLVARLTYYFSKRTAVYGGVGRMKNSGLSAVPLDAGGTVGASKPRTAS
jgi:predicted porin